MILSKSRLGGLELENVLRAYGRRLQEVLDCLPGGRRFDARAEK